MMLLRFNGNTTGLLVTRNGGAAVCAVAANLDRLSATDSDGAETLGSLLDSSGTGSWRALIENWTARGGPSVPSLTWRIPEHLTLPRLTTSNWTRPFLIRALGSLRLVVTFQNTLRLRWTGLARQENCRLP